jgi:hypothetical protein
LFQEHHPYRSSIAKFKINCKSVIKCDFTIFFFQTPIRAKCEAKACI